MPPIIKNMHGPWRYGPSITRNLITDQTPETIIDVNGGAVWAFNVLEGLGVAPAGAQSLWYFPGDLQRQYMLSEWRYVSSAAGRYMGMVARAATPGAGTLGYYLLGVQNSNTVRIVGVTGAGDAVLATAAIPALELTEIFRLQAWVLTNYGANTQNIILEQLSRARVSNTPGAANYNLAAIGDPCNFNLDIDGGVTQTITFSSLDAIVIANGGLGALTNVGVAAVLNDQMVGGYAMVPTGATYVVIYTNTWASSGAIDIDAVVLDANAAFGFPVVEATGSATQVRVLNNDRIRGFSGVIGGHGGNTASWVRSFAISGV